MLINRKSFARYAGAAALLLALAGSGSVLAADPQNGGSLYSRHCVSCHGGDGKGTMPGVPDFTRGDITFKPNGQLADVVRNGKQVMPAFQGVLSDQDIDDVIAYLRTLR